MITQIPYAKFKQLLEYFVAHMEYVTTKDQNHPGYELYIRPLEEAGTFKYTGTGYNGQQIQQQVSQWSKYSVGEVAMNCSPQYGNYRTRMCYLNWIPTGLNVNAIWGNEHISSLQLENYIDKNNWKNVAQPVSLEQLGLYDGQEANDTLKSFFNSFINMKMEWNQIMESKPYTDILEKNYNLVLTGAPGTGKTFLAKQIAYAMTGDNERNHPHIEFVQFHPSYDYTDFVEGLRPTPLGPDGNIVFTRQDGIFKEFCKAALKKHDEKFVFIIDEINRGDIAKIFGELFFSLDPGYRGEKGRIRTQYSNLIKDGDVFKEGFYVPDNVYIIGTMNDVDRNVESMDFAIRRRFTWRQIAPENTQDVILAELGADVDETKKRMDMLNASIRAEKSQLGENFCIGAAYFRKVDDSPEKWDNLWNYHLKPLLEEYVRGLPDAEKLMKKFEAAYDGKTQADANTNAQ